MRNIMLAGVGGQGTVLAAKVLAQAAQHKGWHVRTAETIGMAQRGGSVVSHVRMGDAGEEVLAPLVAPGTAQLIIAFEPAEAARVLPYLASDGVLVTAITSIQPVTSALSKNPYQAQTVIEQLIEALEGSDEGKKDALLLQRAQENGSDTFRNADCTTHAFFPDESKSPLSVGKRLVLVNDAALLKQLPTRKVLNTVLLGCAQQAGKLPLTMEELASAVRACVKPRFVDMNVEALLFVQKIFEKAR